MGYPTLYSVVVSKSKFSKNLDGKLKKSTSQTLQNPILLTKNIHVCICWHFAHSWVLFEFNCLLVLTMDPSGGRRHGWVVLWFGLALLRTCFTRAGASLYKILTSCRAHRSLKDKQQACGERELSGQENPLHIIPHQPLLTSASQRFLSCEGIPPEGPETINDRNTVEFYFGIECDSFVDLV